MEIDREHAIMSAIIDSQEYLPMPEHRRKQYQNTTVRLPRGVYDQTKTAIKKSEATPSFNEFVVQAIKEKLHKLTESEIDAAFAGMAHDPDYQRDSIALAKEFEHSDAEAWQATDDTHEHSKTRSR
jgi:hypothetical protein